MEFINQLSQLHIKEKTAVTLGKFDGLHRGHKKLLNQVLRKKEEGYRSAIFTFDIPPKNMLNGKNGRLILTNKERTELLKQYKVDILFECPFTKEVATMEPEQFVAEILLGQMNAGYIVVGSDFRFGHNRMGDIYILDHLSRKYNFKLLVLAKEQYQGRDISSTYIRDVLKEGKIELAAFLLGYPYFITGQVVKGKQLGREFGTPTLNQIPKENKLLPPDGVYASQVYLEGEKYKGMTNIGFRPTVENTQVRNVETFLFGFEGDLYGKDIKVELLSYIRPEQKFDSIEGLKLQLLKDKETIKKWHLGKSI
ncbi:MAG: bifunctional riboflavin kinase/FAD synthetase [Lachnospiraceae bacterium]|nr:bifunctional riboflavin kinase/FAD synthetase [Lachnospiraceae bacterium]